MQDTQVFRGQFSLNAGDSGNSDLFLINSNYILLLDATLDSMFNTQRDVSQFLNCLLAPTQSRASSSNPIASGRQNTDPLSTGPPISLPFVT